MIEEADKVWVMTSATARPGRVDADHAARSSCSTRRQGSRGPDRRIDDMYRTAAKHIHDSLNAAPEGDP